VLATLERPELEIEVGRLTFVDVCGLHHLRALEDQLRLAGITVSRSGDSPCLDQLEASLSLVRSLHDRSPLVSEPGRPEPGEMGPVSRAR